MAKINNVHYHSSTFVQDWTGRITNLNDNTVEEFKGNIYKVRHSQDLGSFPFPFERRKKPSKSKIELLKRYQTIGKLERVSTENLIAAMKFVVRDPPDGSGSNTRYEGRIDWSPTKLPLDPTILSVNAERCAAKARSWLESERMSFAENIGEYSETASLVGKGVDLIIGAANLARGRRPPLSVVNTAAKFLEFDESNNIRRRKFGLRHLSAAWVFGQFGLKPMLDTINQIQYQLSGQKGLISIRHQLFNSGDTQEIKDVVVHSWDDHFNERYEIVANGTINYREQWKLYAEADYGKASFTVGNPLEWVWAAIPFSFVLDWFSNVSASLASMNDLPPGMSVYGSKVLTVKQNLTFSLRASKPYPGISITDNECLLVTEDIYRSPFDVNQDMGVLPIRANLKMSMSKGATLLALGVLLTKKAQAYVKLFNLTRGMIQTNDFQASSRYLPALAEMGYRLQNPNRL